FRLKSYSLLPPELPVQEAEVEEDTRSQSHQRINRGAEQRVETEPSAEEVRAVSAEHDEFAVGDVHHFRHSPDEIPPVGDHRADAALEDAVCEVLEDDGSCVDHRTLQILRLSFRCTGTGPRPRRHPPGTRPSAPPRSEEHTSSGARS